MCLLPYYMEFLKGPSLDLSYSFYVRHLLVACSTIPTVCITIDMVKTRS